MPVSVTISKKMTEDGKSWRYNYVLPAPYSVITQFIFDSEAAATAAAKEFVAAYALRQTVANSVTTVSTVTI